MKTYLLKTLLMLILLTGTSLNSFAAKCISEAQKSVPPRLVNGEWIKAKQPSAKERTQADYDKLKQMNFDFVFSGIYSKEASLSGKKLSFIKTKKIWQGKVTDMVDIDFNKPPTDAQCSQMKYDQEYIFFGKLGNRKDPILLKSFRKATPELKALLGKPTKQWLRGRLIHSRQ